MKRRDFFTAGALAVAALPGGGTAAAAVDDEHYPVGDFILTHKKRGLRVAHKREPDRVIWETDRSGNFIFAETVFLRKGGASNAEIIEGLKGVGVLN